MEPVPSVSPLDLNTKPPTFHTALSGMPVSLLLRLSIDELPAGRYLRTPGRAFQWAHGLSLGLWLWLALSALAAALAFVRRGLRRIVRPSATIWRDFVPFSPSQRRAQSGTEFHLEGLCRKQVTAQGASRFECAAVLCDRKAGFPGNVPQCVFKSRKGLQPKLPYRWALQSIAGSSTMGGPLFTMRQPMGGWRW